MHMHISWVSSRSNWIYDIASSVGNAVLSRVGLFRGRLVRRIDQLRNQGLQLGDEIGRLRHREIYGLSKEDQTYGLSEEDQAKKKIAVAKLDLVKKKLKALNQPGVAAGLELHIDRVELDAETDRLYNAGIEYIRVLNGLHTLERITDETSNEHDQEQMEAERKLEGVKAKLTDLKRPDLVTDLDGKIDRRDSNPRDMTL